MLNKNWQSGWRPAGPYKAGSTDGRLRELEDQVDDLTSAVNSLLEIIRISRHRDGEVEIVAKRSLVLASPPARIELQHMSITASNGFTLPAKDITR